MNQYLLRQFIVDKFHNHLKSQALWEKMKICKKEDEKLELYDKYLAQKRIEEIELNNQLKNKQKIKSEDILGIFYKKVLDQPIQPIEDGYDMNNQDQDKSHLFFFRSKFPSKDFSKITETEQFKKLINKLTSDYV